MPKEKSSRSLVSHKNRYHAYKQPSHHGKGHDPCEEGTSSDGSSKKKDWEDAVCPICMDFPHNAVLLFCSSHDKGCRPYMCNTSYRHSNCLDQYRKASLGAHKCCTSREPGPESSTIHTVESRAIDDSGRTPQRRVRSASVGGGATGVGNDHILVEESDCVDELEVLGASPSSLKCDIKGLLCPLCRGKVKGWKVESQAREFLNSKTRNCSHEACSFTGNYEELRAHARREHPTARPSEIDPARQRDWRRLERRRDIGDVLSTIHSAMPGATVLGDYVIEDDPDEEDDGVDFPGDDGHWWTVFLLFQVFGPVTGEAPRMRSHLRVPRRGLWGQSLPHGGSADADTSSGGSESDEPVRRSSRRRDRSRHRTDS